MVLNKRVQGLEKAEVSTHSEQRWSEPPTPTPGYAPVLTTETAGVEEEKERLLSVGGGA